MKYHFKIHKEKKGFWAECLELNGCVTQGSSMEALHKNMEEALNLYLDEPEDSKVVLPLPKKKCGGWNVVQVSVDPNIAFAFYLRQLRLKEKLTQQQVAKKLGIKNIYSYQRLESSSTANPALSTLERLKKIFPQLRIDEILA